MRRRRGWRGGSGGGTAAARTMGGANRTTQPRPPPARRARTGPSGGHCGRARAPPSRPAVAASGWRGCLWTWRGCCARARARAASRSRRRSGADLQGPASPPAIRAVALEAAALCLRSGHEALLIRTVPAGFVSPTCTGRFP